MPLGPPGKEHRIGGGRRRPVSKFVHFLTVPPQCDVCLILFGFIARIGMIGRASGP